MHWPAKTEANLESVNGRSAEFFKTSVLYARRKLIPRLSFETSVIYRGTYGRKIPLSAMDDSCMILWWVKNKRLYQLFMTSSRDFMDVQRRMPASKISMVTFWSGRTSDVAQGGMTMRDSATAGLGDQPPAPPRTLEQIPLQELYRPVPEEVLPPVTPPPLPAGQPIEVDDEDMQPPDQPQQSMQPPLTPPHGGLHVPLPDSPMQDSIPGSPGPPQDPPPPSPPAAGVPIQAPGSPMIHWVCCSRNTTMDATSYSESRSATSALATASSADHCAAVDATFMVATYLSRNNSSGRGNVSFRGNFTLRGNNAISYTASCRTATAANAVRAITVSLRLYKHWTTMMMRTYQRTSQCQHSHCCQHADRVHLLLLILELLLRRLLRLRLLQHLGFRLLLRHLFRLCLLRLLLMHLLRVLLLQLPKRPDKKTLQRSNHGWQPMPNLQPPLPTSSSSPAALDEPTTTSSPTEPETKKHKQQHKEDEDEDNDMESFHPLQPSEPSVLPLSEVQPAAAADLEASRSRSRTHSEVSEAPTIQYQDPASDLPRSIWTRGSFSS